MIAGLNDSTSVLHTYVQALVSLVYGAVFVHRKFLRARMFSLTNCHVRRAANSE